MIASSESVHEICLLTSVFPIVMPCALKKRKEKKDLHLKITIKRVVNRKHICMYGSVMLLAILDLKITIKRVINRKHICMYGSVMLLAILHLKITIKRVVNRKHICMYGSVMLLAILHLKITIKRVVNRKCISSRHNTKSIWHQCRLNYTML